MFTSSPKIIVAMSGKLKQKNRNEMVKILKRFLDSVVIKHQTKVLNINFKNDDPHANEMRIRKGPGTDSISIC